jgi:hypothetical protein
LNVADQEFGPNEGLDLDINLHSSLDPDLRINQNIGSLEENLNIDPEEYRFGGLSKYLPQEGEEELRSESRMDSIPSNLNIEETSRKLAGVESDRTRPLVGGETSRTVSMRDRDILREKINRLVELNSKLETDK